MELLIDDETGVLEQIVSEIVDHDDLGFPITESYALRHDFPARPGTPEYRDAILPYVQALVWFFAPDPDDIDF